MSRAIINQEDIDNALSAPVHEPTREIAMQGFQSSAGDVGALATHAGGIAAVAREEAEIKAAIVLAMQHPRDEAKAYTTLLKSCERPRFADAAQYEFERGGSTIKGPSIDLAREMARVWGNMRYGIRVVSDDGKSVHIKGYCTDMQTNNTSEFEDKFAKLIQRKVFNEVTKRKDKTAWVIPDERDLRELVFRRGAILVRNAILTLIPPDIIDEACAKCDETLDMAAKNEIKTDRVGAIRRMAATFDELGVTTEMLKQFLGHDLESTNADELAKLRRIFKSISDGQSTRDEHFKFVGAPVAPVAPVPATGRSEALLNEIGGAKPTQPPAQAVQEARSGAQESGPQDAKPLFGGESPRQRGRKV